MNSIYNALKLNHCAAIAAYDKLLKIKGLCCKVQRPVSQETIFGLEDMVEYNEENTTTEKLLIFGLFQETEIGMESYDSFTPDTYVLTTYDKKLPQQTIIEINFCGRIMSYKVDTHHNLVPSVNEQLFIKNMLVAAT